VRQHVNPLSRFFQLSVDILSPDELFSESNLPIHLDIGCARGRFLLDFAASETKWNFIGIDIRSSLVAAAEREREKLELNNLRFVFCNANVSLENWLLKLRTNQLQRVSIQFPDPWFKKRHQKRRVLQPSLLIALANRLPPGAELFVQSDVSSVINQMIELIQLSQCFESNDFGNEHQVNDNPFDLTTEREQYALKKGLKVYRSLFYRNNNSISNKFFSNTKSQHD